MSPYRVLFVLGLSALVVADARAQQPQTPSAASPLVPTRWGVVYDVPATRRVTMRADVPYLSDARGTLTLDLYLPPDMRPGERRPAIVFVNAVGDRPGDRVKRWEIYTSWPRLTAAHGLVGVSMDADQSRIQESIRAAFSFLTARGAEHGIDGSRLGVYAASANVSGTAQFLADTTASRGIRAAVLYYGMVPAGSLRTDLPVLFLVAESDAPGMGPALPGLWQRVVEAKAPWTLLFASRMPHAFDAFEDTDDARRIIRQTLAFWSAHLEPVPAPPWQPSPARAIISASYGNDPQRSVQLLEPWLAEHPQDVEALRQYARALQQLQRLAEASGALERALALRPQDPGLLWALGQQRLAEQRWENATDLLARAVAGGIRNGRILGQLAFAQMHIGRNAEAIRSYETALELGIPAGAATRGVAYYNLACAYARVGRAADALTALSRAIDEGFSNRQSLETDPDLAPVRSDPRFRELLARLERKPGG
jgi:Flp pilus assembly protein TadD/dienelactone hydrolase